MLCDAHIHMGYYSRKGQDTPFYYSPRRIVGIVNRCGVDEFVVSSTCSQVSEIGIDDIVREAREMIRLEGQRAHVFFWLSGHLYDEDRTMVWLQSGLFEGIKLHEGETPWMMSRQSDLRNILSRARERDLPVMLHSGENGGCRPLELVKIVHEYPTVRFNFAHCRPMDEMAMVIADCPNVWTDTAYMALEDFPRLCSYDWDGRLMFGTDLPVWQAHEDVSLTKRYRECVRTFQATGFADSANHAFCEFIKPRKDSTFLPSSGEKRRYSIQPGKDKEATR